MINLSWIIVLDGIDVKSRLRTSTVSISGGLVVCMSLFRESLSQSFFIIFALYAFMITYLIYSFYRLKQEISGRLIR